MNTLLDTCVFLWWLDDPAKVKSNARDTIENGSNNVFVSTVSLWEISIKKSLGKLKIPSDIRTVIDSNRFSVLPIEPDHVYTLDTLPVHHRDPFDRMLVAQAISQNLVLISRDVILQRYDVNYMEG